MKLLSLAALACTPVIPIPGPEPLADAGRVEECRAVTFERLDEIARSSVVFPFAGEAIVVDEAGRSFAVGPTGPPEPIELPPLPPGFRPTAGYAGEGRLFLAGASPSVTAGLVLTHEVGSSTYASVTTPEPLLAIDGRPDGSEMFGASRSEVWRFDGQRWSVIPYVPIEDGMDERRRAVALYVGPGRGMVSTPKGHCTTGDLPPGGDRSCLVDWRDGDIDPMRIESRVTTAVRHGESVVIGDASGTIRVFDPRFASFSPYTPIFPPAGVNERCADAPELGIDALGAIVSMADRLVYLSCAYVQQQDALESPLCRTEEHGPSVESSAVVRAAAIDRSTIVAVGATPFRITLGGEP
jgi:hypothetical protein